MRGLETDHTISGKMRDLEEEKMLGGDNIHSFIPSNVHCVEPVKRLVLKNIKEHQVHMIVSNVVHH